MTDLVPVVDGVVLTRQRRPGRDVAAAVRHYGDTRDAAVGRRAASAD